MRAQAPVASLDESVWLKEARRYWWKARREKSQPYRAVWEREMWRLLMIEAGASSWFVARPSAEEFRRRDLLEARRRRLP
jgi:hypothetical protein